MVALDGMVLTAEIGAGAVASDFSDDHDRRYGREGGTSSGLRGSVRLSFSSSRGADGGGGAR